MAKILKKKFFEIEIPLINEKYEAYVNSVQELDKRTIKVDATRKLKGKGVDLIFTIKIEDHKAIAEPKKLFLLSSFIGHMMHKGVSYIEDSITTETKESIVVIKPFLITRKKVSRAVRRTMRNSARNWIIEYLKDKEDYDLFDEILSNQFQKPLSLKLKKIYPLAICEVKSFEIRKSLGKKKEPKPEKRDLAEAMEEEQDTSNLAPQEIEMLEEKKAKKVKKEAEEKAD